MTGRQDRAAQRRLEELIARQGRSDGQPIAIALEPTSRMETLGFWREFARHHGREVIARLRRRRRWS